MTNSKIDRIEKEMQKTREKITEYQNRLKELAMQKTEAENLQIISSCALHAPDPRRAYRPAFRRADPRHCRRRDRLHGTGGNRR